MCLCVCLSTKIIREHSLAKIGPKGHSKASRPKGWFIKLRENIIILVYNLIKQVLTQNIISIELVVEYFLPYLPTGLVVDWFPQA